MKVYDKVKYHIEGNFPPELNKRQAGVPTGMFLSWLAMNNLVTNEVRQDFLQDSNAVQNLFDRPSELYFAMDGVFAEDELSPEGNDFSLFYFDFDHGKYLDDFIDVLVGNLPTVYHVEDSWQNFYTLKPRIDDRYHTWKQSSGNAAMKADR